MKVRPWTGDAFWSTTHTSPSGVDSTRGTRSLSREGASRSQRSGGGFTWESAEMSLTDMEAGQECRDEEAARGEREPASERTPPGELRPRDRLPAARWLDRELRLPCAERYEARQKHHARHAAEERDQEERPPADRVDEEAGE